MKTKVASAIYEIPTSRIEPDPAQPRKEFDPEYIEQLGCSIQAEGLLQPITVRPNLNKPEHYLIITGECRWRAHALKAIQSVRCIVSKGHESEARRFRAQVLENMGRKNMTLREEANALKKMHEMGDSDEVIASSVGLTPYRVRNIRLLADLSSECWFQISSGAILRSVAEWAMAHVTQNEAEQLLMRCANKGQDRSMVIISAFMYEKQQASLELAFDNAGVSQKRDSIAKDIATQLIAISNAVGKLKPNERRQFARSIGNEIIKMLPAKMYSECATDFLSSVCKQVSALAKL